MMRREICEHLRFGSHCTAWADADKIVSADEVERRRISVDLCLNAFIIQLSYGLLEAASFIFALALLLPWGDRGSCQGQDGYNECSFHREFFFVNLFGI